jgi:transcriptional regulator with XRE-family HTH domain
MFAEEMKAARQRAGWTQEELAEKIKYSASLIGMVEAGHRTPQPELAMLLDQVFQTPGTFARMQARLRDLPFPASYRPFVQFEAEARTLRMFEHSLVPGLFQTQGYAHAVLSKRPLTDDDEIDGLVAARLQRQAVLRREDPPVLWVLLDEGVLHRPVAEPGVMRDQMRYLSEVSRMSHVTMQVIPYAAGGHIGMVGAFVIAELHDSSAIVYLEDAADGRVAEDATVVASVGLRFDALRSEALTRSASRNMIAEAEERWTQLAPTGAKAATQVQTEGTASR